MLEPSETSYFSPPSAGLDPRLISNGKLDASVRSAVLQLMLSALSKYSNADVWASAWLAGSGVSYQWTAQREPADLDCLLVIDFPKFRMSNTAFRGLSDQEIASMLNEDFRAAQERAAGLFMGVYELTFYAITAHSILDIKPYAAYSLTNDTWTVTPQRVGQSVVPEWENAVEQDRNSVLHIVSQFLTAKNRHDHATNPAVKANARSDMRLAASQSHSLYNDIHENRSLAFSPSGQGYADFNNYRWQAGKRTGAIKALRNVLGEMDKQDEEFTKSTYGVDLPDTRTLIRRAATYN